MVEFYKIGDLQSSLRRGNESEGQCVTGRIRRIGREKLGALGFLYDHMGLAGSPSVFST